MARFRCKVVDSTGVHRRIERSGSSAAEVAGSFSHGELFLESIEEIGAEASGPRKRPYPASAVREFTEMTSLFLESGLTLRDALEIESGIAPGGPLGTLIDELLGEIQKGESFADVVEARPETFPPLYRGMVRIGDRIGAMENVLPRLSAYLTERKALRDKLSGALAYPLLVLIVALVGSAAIVIFFLPRLTALFSELGGDGAESIGLRMEAASRAFRVGAALVALVIAGLAAAFALRRREGKAGKAIDAAVLRLPAIGSLMRSWETLNFSFAMETLASGGVPLEVALGEAASVAGNQAFRAAVLDVRDALRRGEPLSKACERRPEFPRYIARWIAAGEQTGHTGKVFSQIRRYFQAEIDRNSARFMALVEPALILLVGAIVLFLVTTFVIPLFSLYGTVL